VYNIGIIENPLSLALLGESCRRVEAICHLIQKTEPPVRLLRQTFANLLAAGPYVWNERDDADEAEDEAA
jgi:hypothetical protein